MGIFEWGAVTVLVALGTIIWRLATVIQKTADKASAAEILASGASGKAIEVERALARHKEHVAAEYVSRDAMAEVTAAINRLGDRLDSLFIHFIPKPGA